jgi:hypothetical protein
MTFATGLGIGFFLGYCWRMFLVWWTGRRLRARLATYHEGSLNWEDR